MRSLMAGRQDFRRHLGPDDLLLVPPLAEGLGLLDWHRHTDVMDHAFAWTRREIASARTGDGALSAWLRG
jgi:hypothetical protein